MPTELFERLDLDKIYPRFLARALNVIAECRDVGQLYFATLGFRTFHEQAKLYFQGRTAPGKIVTNAQAGYSAHNYGLAIDFCHDADPAQDGLQPDWSGSAYAKLGEVTKAHGLVWGGDFHSVDRPHIQWPGFVTGSELEPLRKLYLKNNDLQAVWKFLDASSSISD